jgi:hypothetical protein
MRIQTDEHEGALPREEVIGRMVEHMVQIRRLSSTSEEYELSGNGFVIVVSLPKLVTTRMIQYLCRIVAQHCGVEMPLTHFYRPGRMELH